MQRDVIIKEGGRLYHEYYVSKVEYDNGLLIDGTKIDANEVIIEEGDKKLRVLIPVKDAGKLKPLIDVMEDGEWIEIDGDTVSYYTYALSFKIQSGKLIIKDKEVPVNSNTITVDSWADGLVITVHHMI